MYKVSVHLDSYSNLTCTVREACFSDTGYICTNVVCNVLHRIPNPGTVINCSVVLLVQGKSVGVDRASTVATGVCSEQGVHVCND